MARRMWKPEFLEIKGWVKNWSNPKKRSEEMLGQKDLQTLVSNMVDALPEDTKMCVDKDRTIRLNAGRTLYGQGRVGVRTGTT
eukprot:8560457-Pyramimonas_sp.AAC.1